MAEGNVRNSFVLGLFICLGLVILGFALGSSLIKFKEFERTVSVKGLSERELPADIALWPIQFASGNDDLAAFYLRLERDTEKILRFLAANGIDSGEITVSVPAVVDKLAQQYGGSGNVGLRYTGSRTVTVYSQNIDVVRSAIRKLAELGKEGIAFAGESYQTKTEYIFRRLNDVKPEMIEEATRKAREVAVKFAQDSDSKLGKIKKAYQGQFSINDRDANTPHIKKIRVVATIEYYLSD
jgi:hypothetical protein